MADWLDGAEAPAARCASSTGFSSKPRSAELRDCKRSLLYGVAVLFLDPRVQEQSTPYPFPTYEYEAAGC